MLIYFIVSTSAYWYILYLCLFKCNTIIADLLFYVVHNTWGEVHAMYINKNIILYIQVCSVNISICRHCSSHSQCIINFTQLCLGNDRLMTSFRSKRPKLIRWGSPQKRLTLGLSVLELSLQELSRKSPLVSCAGAELHLVAVGLLFSPAHINRYASV